MVEPQEVEAMLQALVQLNARVVTAIERLEVTTARLEVTTARIELTLQAIKDMLGRGNGRP